MFEMGFWNGVTLRGEGCMFGDRGLNRRRGRERNVDGLLRNGWSCRECGEWWKLCVVRVEMREMRIEE